MIRRRRAAGALFWLVALAGGAAAGGTVTLSEADLVPSGMAGVFLAPGAVPPPPDPALPALPVVSPEAADPAALLLRRLVAQGRAAGFPGVLYDNRDRGHSALPEGLFPSLARLAYGEGTRAQGLDYGLAGMILFPGPVIGNSSTAVTGGRAPRSLTRLAMTSPGGALRSYVAYAGNALYVYPEHRDHDAHDLYPANWPYTVTSQGSSGSDQPFLRALALTLAAFTPETRARLEAERLIAPTLQMILRRSLGPVTSRAAYLSGLAHPAAFDAADLVPGRMVTLAAALRPETIPPMVRLSVLAESFAADGGEGRSERLFDTPSALARIWRGPEAEKTMTVSAARTFDPNGRPLTFSWVLVRGDPGRVRIEPFGPDEAQARITVLWQDPAAGGPAGMPPGARVDIGIFAWNGVHDSAPAFVSVLLPLHEGQRPASRPGIPVDPVLFPDAATP
jgi:hypothetical protein